MQERIDSGYYIKKSCKDILAILFLFKIFEFFFSFFRKKKPEQRNENKPKRPHIKPKIKPKTYEKPKKVKPQEEPQQNQKLKSISHIFLEFFKPIGMLLLMILFVYLSFSSLNFLKKKYLINKNKLNHFYF
ncbi:hypothetical protein M0811_03256 [Anaeramoeba ignava]|uniref:Uncharacterized protein n=1 Tax=Anaeramoeba ignava TaxID=1746090 RepID=A0A9Q0R4E9_ANAIG|nr:hypothetical protein M0811_03256 [Anaeramoeba ignava]